MISFMYDKILVFGIWENLGIFHSLLKNLVFGLKNGINR
jgi:hypothetical protein